MPAVRQGARAGSAFDPRWHLEAVCRRHVEATRAKPLPRVRPAFFAFDQSHPVRTLHGGGFVIVDPLLLDHYVLTLEILISDRSDGEKRWMLDLSTLGGDVANDDPQRWDAARAVLAQLLALDRQHRVGDLDAADYDRQIDAVVTPLPLATYLRVVDCLATTWLALAAVLRRGGGPA
jgi:hypothetical protein